eukprot:14854760-Heterocapsa_arctica.AAC.1
MTNVVVQASSLLLRLDVRLNVVDVVILLQLDDQQSVGAGVACLLAIATSPSFYFSTSSAAHDSS